MKRRKWRVADLFAQTDPHFVLGPIAVVVAAILALIVVAIKAVST